MMKETDEWVHVKQETEYEEKQMPKLTSSASSAVMALKMFMTLFFFYVDGVAAGGLHGSFSSNSPIRELARGAFLASWPVTNVPV